MARQDPIQVHGVLVQRDFPHLGGKLRVLVETENGWQLLHEWPREGHISHIFEPSGIAKSPVMRMEAEG
jgi:hypothetical protein